MKKHYYKLWFFFCCVSISYSQNTYVPDDNFEQELIHLGYDSGPLDNYVPTANIDSITYLEVGNENISDLTGIENFVALEELFISLSNLTSIDLSQNIELEVFNANYNYLISLDVSQNTKLVNLQCHDNALSSIDVTNNPLLKHLNIKNNYITAIDVSQNPLLETLGLNDDYSSTNYNSVTSLDLSNNLLLKHLSVNRNEITSLDVTSNVLLETLEAVYNEISNLDLSQNPLLSYINIGSNQILDLQLPLPSNRLELLSINNNQLSNYDIISSLDNYTSLTGVFRNNNNFSGPIPNLTNLTDLTALWINDNYFHFGDFEDEHNDYLDLSNYNYSPQGKINTEITLNPCQGNNVSIGTYASGNQNHYQWYKGNHPNGTILSGETNSILSFNPIQFSDAGDYYCQVTSDIVSNLTLVREPIHINAGVNAIIANSLNDVMACDDDNDGYSEFQLNLATIEGQVLGSQTGLNVNYYDILGNPIQLTNQFTNTTINSQTIIVRVEPNFGCYAETSFQLIINSPLVDILDDQFSCDTFLLPELSNGNYFTQTNGNGMPLFENDEITTSQTLYIYNENENCFTESSFNITIEASPPIDTLEDVSLCNSYTLQALTHGHYFNEPYGEGTPFFAGDVINESSIMYIYNEANGCYSQSFFNIEIYPSIDFDLELSYLTIFKHLTTINLPNNGIDYEYAIDNFSYQSSNQFFNLEDGEHTLYVRDHKGCVVKSLDFFMHPRFIIPSYFTPNGDGFNDFWQILDSQNTITIVTIFNRYGKHITTIKPSSYGWNGTLKNSALPSDDYWYTIQLKNGTVLKGHFALVR